MKYILGYSVEGQNLADDFINSEKESCREAAEGFKSLNLNPNITKDIYRTFANALSKLADLRKGFYCIVCDANT